MKGILKRFSVSGKHLTLLDDFLLDNDDEYRRMEDQLEQMGEDYIEFCRQLYFGGSKSRGAPPRGSRQMILSDILQYVITSRGFYLAARDDEHREKFTKIVMCLVNQWLLMDCCGASEVSNLRRELMLTLKNGIDNDYFFEAEQHYHIRKFEDSLQYSGDLIPKPPNPNPPRSQILDSYDSLFPKVRGGPIEILVYLYLLQRKLGFVVSLLTQQRLLGRGRAIAPPDLLLLRRKGEIMGLEIGRGKERQSADFGLLTGIPTFSIDLVDRQPFRCDACGRWIIYCDRVIQSYSEDGVPENHDHVIHCVDCPNFSDGDCPQIICHVEAQNRYDDTRKARYHLRCLNSAVQSIDPECLVSYYPLVAGLEEFPEE